MKGRSFERKVLSGRKKKMESSSAGAAPEPGAAPAPPEPAGARSCSGLYSGLPWECRAGASLLWILDKLDEQEEAEKEKEKEKEKENSQKILVEVLLDAVKGVKRKREE